MKKLFILTLIGLVAFSFSFIRCGKPNFSRNSTMNFSVNKQADLDAANHRIAEFKQDLLRQGFREVSISFLDSEEQSKEQSILEGEYGTLEDLQITLRTVKRLENDKAELAGGVEAALRDKQAEQEFDELYKRVCLAVTGHAY